MRVCLFFVMLCIARSLILDADQEYHFHHLEAKFGTPYENRSEQPISKLMHSLFWTNRSFGAPRRLYGSNSQSDRTDRTCYSR